jgi:putative ATPase
MYDLFSYQEENKSAPLAERMRPRNFDEFFGQQHIVGKGRLLRRAIEADRLSSCIFFGPPGVGKTSLAAVVANTCSAHFEKLNAVTAGVPEVREIIKLAEERKKLYNKQTFLLLDECHRWSKAQSDALLPALENGTISLIGSTTENPYISLTRALVSRCRIFEFLPLTKSDIIDALRRALTDERGFGNTSVIIDDAAIEHIASVAAGDVRNAMNALELSVLTTKPDSNGDVHITLEIAEESIQKPVVQIDESLFYDMLSAFCKSMRGSDPDAAVFWAMKLIEGGADPRIIARRMIAHASEDVGMADPMALLQASAALNAVEKLGYPECRLALTQGIIYICTAPKSNSVVMALDNAAADARVPVTVPKHLCDSHYSGHEKLDRGIGYLYPHDYDDHYVSQQYMPDELKDKKYYSPSDQGNEKRISDKLKNAKHY